MELDRTRFSDFFVEVVEVIKSDGIVVYDLYDTVITCSGEEWDASLLGIDEFVLLFHLRDTLHKVRRVNVDTAFNLLLFWQIYESRSVFTTLSVEIEDLDRVCV